VTGLGSLDGGVFVSSFGFATTTTLNVSASQVNEGTPVNLTVIVRKFSGGVPTGSVSIYADGNYVWTGTLDASGQATHAVTLLGGPHSLSAQYSNSTYPPLPGSKFIGSASAPVGVFVIPKAPQTPGLVSPAYAATNVSPAALLSWNPAAGYASYDVYFGTSSTPPFWGTVSGISCSPSMSLNTTYYWKIIARNVSGTAASSIWSFTTSTQTIYQLSRIAGTGTGGALGDGGPATSAHFSQLGDLDAGGTVYYAGWEEVWALSLSGGASALSINADGVRNAASFLPAPAVPGSIATLFGSFSLNAADQAAGSPLPTILSGLSIRLDSTAAESAPLFYASAGQVNIQIPWELSGQSAVPVSVLLDGRSGPSQTLQLASFSPGIFADSSGQGAVVDTLSRLVATSNPTMAGSVIVIYCTGLGAVQNPPTTGSPASTAVLSPTITTPAVTIGGIDAPVLFAGLAPGAVGEYQVNVRVPPGVSPGSAVPVVLSIGGTASNTVTIAVR